ncbi:MAG: ribonuclease HIII [Acidaminococcaceae bacterium]|nr:ribonuclease HIII [Acidaminococcaceae bacterium]
MSDFDQYIKGLQEKFKNLNLDELKLKDINYGKQILLVRQKEKVVLSIYNGKKGRKMVWGGTSSVLQDEARALVNGHSNKNSFGNSQTSYSSNTPEISLLEDIPGFDYLWVGSDESGKGDFFGPLVVASVMVDKAIAIQLMEIGVKDSKMLNDTKICELAAIIERLAPIHVVLALKPEMYNLRYQQLKFQKQNLNHLLANGHTAVLANALGQNSRCKFALVDRFTVKNDIATKLQEQYPLVKVVQQPKAEADIAVAAASILARAKFVQIMDDLSLSAGIELPKGGGKNATECARKILVEQGEDTLKKFVKIHFVNYRMLFDI